MYTYKKNFKQKENECDALKQITFLSYLVSPFSSREKPGKRQQTLPLSLSSALAEGLAVSALVLGGIGLVGAHQNPVQGAVVLAVAVICAGLNGTFDTLICMAIHNVFLL